MQVVHTNEAEEADAPIRRTTETLGVSTETTTSSWLPNIVQSRLRRLIKESDSSYAEAVRFLLASVCMEFQ